MGQLGSALHRGHPVDRLDQVQPLQVMPHEQQRTDLPAGTHRRRVEPGERRRQLVQLARRLQHVLAAERVQQPVPDLPVLGAERLDQPQVRVVLAFSAHLVPFDIHCRTSIHLGPTVWPTKANYKHVTCPCQRV